MWPFTQRNSAYCKCVSKVVLTLMWLGTVPLYCRDSYFPFFVCLFLGYAVASSRTSSFPWKGPWPFVEICMSNLRLICNYYLDNCCSYCVIKQELSYVISSLYLLLVFMPWSSGLYLGIHWIIFRNSRIFCTYNLVNVTGSLTNE